MQRSSRRPRSSEYAMVLDAGPLFAWGAPAEPAVERADYSVRVGSRRLRTTAVFDTYWRFAAERARDVLSPALRRVAGYGGLNSRSAPVHECVSSFRSREPISHRRRDSWERVRRRSVLSDAPVQSKHPRTYTERRQIRALTSVHTAGLYCPGGCDPNTRGFWRPPKIGLAGTLEKRRPQA